MNIKLLFTAFSILPIAAGQLIVTLGPVKYTGQKAVVPIALRNNFEQKIDSARAALFLTDEQGKVVAQGTKWMIGGGPGAWSLPAGGTNVFHFVVRADKPFTTTNLTANLSFVRIALEGGKMIDVKTNVVINRSK